MGSLTYKVIMKCGHSANAEHVLSDGTREPCCAICDCFEVAEKLPDLTGRKARCDYYGFKCRSERDSRIDLPFFEYCPDKKHDRFYCGCYGWD